MTITDPQPAVHRLPLRRRRAVRRRQEQPGNALLEREPGIRLSVSYTTRPPRPGESEGNHYHFVDVASSSR